MICGKIIAGEASYNRRWDKDRELSWSRLGGSHLRQDRDQDGSLSFCCFQRKEHAPAKARTRTGAERYLAGEATRFRT